MARYAYEDLYPAQFEELVVAICACILGSGVQPFSTGADGGRDARFSGTACHLPSVAAPLRGQFVAQAKHTEHPFAKFSDTDFSGDSDSATLTREIPRIRKLVQAGELDHYLLFSNRRLGGSTDEALRKRLVAETGAKTIDLFGVERIELLIKAHPNICSLADISEVNQPLRVSPDDLAEVILALANNKCLFQEAIQPSKIQRTSFAKKNQLNRLGDGFARKIRRDYMPHFAKLREFLAQPPNAHIQIRYLEAANEFGDQVLAHRNEWNDFGDALVYLHRILFQRDGDLARNKRITKAVVYYMYWNCDIGEEGSDA